MPTSRELDEYSIYAMVSKEIIKRTYGGKTCTFW